MARAKKAARRAPARPQHTVKSARNGLILNVPTDARGVIGRFATKGDNELVFENPTNRKPPKDDKPVKLVTDGSNEKPADLA